MYDLSKADTQSISVMGYDELVLLIDKADAAYYRTGSSALISDELYDAAKARLKSEFPNDLRNTRVGLPYELDELRTKVKHPIPMGSLDNTDDGILGYHKWYDGLLDKLGLSENIGIMASLKIDGSSIRASYDKGKLVMVASRGNGEMGENITINGINFQNLPLQLPVELTCDVRGEAVLPIAAFKSLMAEEHGLPFEQIDAKDISNPRNVGNGILGRDNGLHSDLIQFYAFDIVISGETFSSDHHKFQKLLSLGFETVPHVLCDTPDMLTSFYEQAIADRSDLPFEIDGIVVAIDSHASRSKFQTNDSDWVMRPKHAKAIKFPHKSATSEIIGVDITVGHTGAIIPTAILRQVRIGGVNVEHALLNNWDEIDRLKVGIGDEVEIVLAGDIIPKIIRKVKSTSKSSTILEPHICPACGSFTTRVLRGKSGAVTFCSAPQNCPDALLAKIKHWIGSSKTGVGILGIGDAIIKALWDNKLIHDPADLYALTVDKIKDVLLDGSMRIGEARATMIIDNINAKRQLPIHIFLGSLGIELLGRRRVLLLQKSAKGQLDSLNQWLDPMIWDSIEIEGLGDAIRQAIKDGIEANRKLILKFFANGVGVPDPVIDESDSDTVGSLPFKGMTFCFTGTRDCIKDVERLGGEIKSGVSKNLSVLVVKDASSTSSKAVKAFEYGIDIMTIDDLKNKIRAFA